MDTDEGKEVVINDKINPTEFDVTMHALLVGLDAEKYVEIFRYNLCDLNLINVIKLKVKLICVF